MHMVIHYYCQCVFRVLGTPCFTSLTTVVSALSLIYRKRISIRSFMSPSVSVRCTRQHGKGASETCT